MGRTLVRGIKGENAHETQQAWVQCCRRLRLHAKCSVVLLVHLWALQSTAVQTCYPVCLADSVPDLFSAAEDVRTSSSVKR